MAVLTPDFGDFSRIDCGDEIVLGQRRYRITGFERERRFGIEDPKFWVKRALDVETGERKLLKFAFFESFYTSLAGVKIRCFRNPEKESRILELVEGHPFFMQGSSFWDEKGFDPEKIRVELVQEPYPTITEGIIDYYNQGDFDMLMIGRKKMSKQEEFVLGDISIKLIRALGKTAVLVVKTG